ncbi:hypothetical protein P9112_010636 [Eukaryota sp. TZLM1-RC]
MLDYSDVQYWNRRYSKDPSLFDWLLDYTNNNTFRETLTQKIPSKQSNILITGTGLSRLPFQLYKAGYTSIAAIDYSSTCISTLKEQKHARNITFRQVDLKSPFNDLARESYDVAIDKAMLDSQFCSSRASETAPLILSNIHSLLSPNGIFISLSFVEPGERTPLFSQKKWKVEVVEIPREDSGNFYCYIAEKKEVEDD